MVEKYEELGIPYSFLGTPAMDERFRELASNLLFENFERACKAGKTGR